MRFTDIFIRRPVLAASISFLLLLLGFNALNSMQVREYPKMTNTVVTVSTSYYGADANLIQGFITQPLEQALAQADNVDFMTSESFLGTSKNFGVYEAQYRSEWRLGRYSRQSKLGEIAIAQRG